MLVAVHGFCCWHETDMRRRPDDIRFWAERTCRLSGVASGFDPAVTEHRRRQRVEPYQLPYLPTIPRQTAPRSKANDSLPISAFLATAVTTMTSFNSGSTKIAWP